MDIDMSKVKQKLAKPARIAICAEDSESEQREIERHINFMLWSAKSVMETKHEDITEEDGTMRSCTEYHIEF